MGMKKLWKNFIKKNPGWARWRQDQIDIIKDGNAPILIFTHPMDCLLYTSPSPRDGLLSRMPSSA